MAGRADLVHSEKGKKSKYGAKGKEKKGKEKRKKKRWRLLLPSTFDLSPELFRLEHKELSTSARQAGDDVLFEMDDFVGLGRRVFAVCREGVEHGKRLQNGTFSRCGGKKRTRRVWLSRRWPP